MSDGPDAPTLHWIDDGRVTTPAGFSAGGIDTGVKTYGEAPRLDLGVLLADRDCMVAGIFTRSQVTGPAVTRNQELLAAGQTGRAILVNSGNANTATGEQGVRDTLSLAEQTAARFSIETNDVWVGSTGVIGRLLPMPVLEAGIAALDVTPEGGGDFARAILTTDTRTKEAAVRFEVEGRIYHVGGCAKGSGMIHPDMATMFGFITTDAPADPAWLQAALGLIADRTFNMLDIDMDTSTSDTVLIFASGAAGGDEIGRGHPAAGALAGALEAVARHLTRELARDGEGAETLIEGVVEGAAELEDARLAARTIVSSPLIKTMVTGNDPNWGRVMMAIGRSGARVDQTLVSVWVGPHCVLERGTPTAVDLSMVSTAMARDEVQLRVDLGLGDGTATAWGCDLTTEYVHINADYTT
jgi:glutamate N-acetyltransferase / amino-acid N-acetyltransferase